MKSCIVVYVILYYDIVVNSAYFEKNLFWYTVLEWNI